MKTKTALIIPLLCSCIAPTLQPSLPDIRGNHLDRNHEIPTETYPEDSSGTHHPPQDPALFICGIEHPDSSSVSLVLLKDMKRILTLPVGKDISADADSHFLIGGTLYTVSTDPWSETVVCRNGNTVFKFEEKEYITDLFEFQGHVWTLGNRRSGEGFALRCEGRKVFERDSGTSRGLHLDGGNIYFTYSDSLSSERMFFLVDGNRAIGLSPRFSGSLLAARMVDSVLWTVEGGTDWCEISSPNEHHAIHIPPEKRLGGASLYKGPDPIPVAILNICDASMASSDLIVRNGNMVLPTGASVGYYYMDPFTRVSSLVNPYRVMLNNNGDHETLEDAVFHGSRCAYEYEGKLYVACSRPSKEKPFVWNEGRITDIPLEGYVTGIEITKPRQSSQLSSLAPSGRTLMNTLSVSSGSSSSTFSGHSMIQRHPESR